MYGASRSTHALHAERYVLYPACDIRQSSKESVRFCILRATRSSSLSWSASKMAEPDSSPSVLLLEVYNTATQHLMQDGLLPGITHELAAWYHIAAVLGASTSEAITIKPFWSWTLLNRDHPGFSGTGGRGFERNWRSPTTYRQENGLGFAQKTDITIPSLLVHTVTTTTPCGRFSSASSMIQAVLSGRKGSTSIGKTLRCSRHATSPLLLAWIIFKACFSLRILGT
ncbi:hypothetical protein BDV96DRAFT_304996 [Lophiotrema nucula]|uniref:Uncharacterized protein n=1 Tax=Lophiotrema nucula TaxID=690887 RepID=A0A6A5YM10_9PLEO|nr:hypothetical protein BDV96DRAFT_304996 [Lophiotrema nucula]